MLDNIGLYITIGCLDSKQHDILRGAADLYELQRGVLYLLVRVLQVQVQEVEDLALVHLASADLIVLQLVPAQNFLSLSMLCYGLYTM